MLGSLGCRYVVDHKPSIVVVDEQDNKILCGQQSILVMAVVELLEVKVF